MVARRFDEGEVLLCCAVPAASSIGRKAAGPTSTPA
jgi:hypothetical protein